MPENLRRATPEETLAAVSGSYKELRTKMSKAPEPDPPPPDEPKKDDEPPSGSLSITKDAPTDTDDLDPVDVLDRAGVSQEDVVAQWNEHGKLSDAHYQALKEAGYGRKAVDSYITGLQAQAALQKQTLEQRSRSIVDRAGGADKYATLANWARSSLNEQQLTWYNDHIDGNSEQDAHAAFAWLSDQYQSKAGVSRVSASAPSSGAPAITTKPELDAARDRVINNRRAGKADPALERAVVEAGRKIYGEGTRR